MSEESEKFLGKIIVARTGQGDTHAVGKCIAYCEAPTVTFNTPSGKQISWRADLCEVIEMPKDVPSEWLIP